MENKEKALSKELKEAQQNLKDLKKSLSEINKKLKLAEKGDLLYEEIKPNFEGK